MKWMKQSLRRQMILLLLLSLTIPIILSIVINYRYTKDSLYNQAIEETLGLLSMGGNEIAEYLDGVNRASLSLYADDELYQVLAGRSTTIGNDFLFSRLTSISRLVKEIRQVYLYSSVQDSSYLILNGTFKKMAGESRPLTEDTQAYDFIFQGVHYQQDSGSTGNSVITLQRPLYRVPSKERIGVIVIDVAPDKINSIFHNLNTSSPGDLLVYDAQGSIFHELTDEPIDARFHHAVNERISNTSPNGHFTINESGFRGVVFYQRMDISGHSFVLAKRISTDTLYEQARRIAWINLLIAMLFFAVASVAIVMVSFNISSPILRLIRHMNRIQSGQLEASIRTEREDEIGLLAHRFQALMDTINDLIRNEYKIKLANQESEIKALLAQINPHFMNNALQSIGGAALEANAPQVYTLVSSLGQMMYYNMNNKELLVTLEQEMNYVQQYLELQQYRFQDQFQYKIDMKSDTRMMMIPKMTLQPIVENYFKHNAWIQRGELTLSAARDEQWLQITVEDNGVGMTAEQAQQLQAYLNAGDAGVVPASSSIGLLNVMERLRLYYGNGMSLQLQAPDTGGLRVRLLIPYQQLRGESPHESIDR